MMTLGRFELCLNVADVATSRAFYERLGFAAVGGDEAKGFVILEGSGLRLALYQGHISENLLNFRGEDVYRLAALLAQRGVPFDVPATEEADGSVGAWIKDPDGNLIYLNTQRDE